MMFAIKNNEKIFINCIVYLTIMYLIVSFSLFISLRHDQCFDIVVIIYFVNIVFTHIPQMHVFRIYTFRIYALRRYYVKH